MPGTELAFDRDVECEAALAIFPTKKIGQRVARFRQVNTEQPTMHHDALEFADGQVVLLTSLCANQHATVLQLPAEPRSRIAAEEGAANAANRAMRRGRRLGSRAARSSIERALADSGLR